MERIDELIAESQRLGRKVERAANVAIFFAALSLLIAVGSLALKYAGVIQ